MPEPVSVSRSYTVPASSTKSFSAYDVPPARVFVLKRVCIHFPVGTGNKLAVRVMHGIAQVVPEKGDVRGDDVERCFTCEQRYESGSSVIVYAVNEDTSNDLAFDITLEGELE